MITWTILVLIVALILAVLAALNVPSSRVNLLAAAFAFFLLYIILGAGGIR